MLKAKALRFDPSYGSRASVLSASGIELHAAKSKMAAKGAAEMRFLLRFDKANIARIARWNGRCLIYDIWNKYRIDRVYNTVGSFDVRLYDFSVVDKQIVVFN